MSLQRSQTAGRVRSRRGPAIYRYERVLPAEAPERESSLFDGLPTEVRSIFDLTGEIVGPEVRNRVHALHRTLTRVREDFAFTEPYRGFEVVPEAGTAIARDGGQAIRTPYDDCVLVMPSPRLKRGQTAVRLGRLIS